jgi:hypothetical protein
MPASILSAQIRCAVPRRTFAAFAVTLLVGATLAGCGTQPPHDEITPEAFDASVLNAVATPHIAAREIIQRFNAGAAAKGDPRVKKLSYAGLPAYLLQWPCCHGMSYLYRQDGTYLCAPSGGLDGNGDGRCPGVARGRAYW